MLSNTKMETFLNWIPRIAMIIAFGGLIPGMWFLLPGSNLWLLIFGAIFVVRYTRFIGHVFGALVYHPSPEFRSPRFNRSDVTVVVPTVDPNCPDFSECIRTILNNRPAHIIVVTVGSELKEDCTLKLQALAHQSNGTTMSVSAIDRPSKRRQIAHVMPRVNTPITILADDHVFWPSTHFIPSVLAPFEDESVAAVATKKRVRRELGTSKLSWSSIVNFIAQNYLERHNWELRASNSVDGGVSVISGRTAVYKTEFLANRDRLSRFCNERFFFGLFGKGGLGPDDDNFLTRELMENGLLIRFQDTEEATIETTLGEWPKFNGQLIRWARTTFRSNPVMLRQPKFLMRYTWTAFMVYWAGLTNFAIIWDGMLFFSLAMAVKLEADHPDLVPAGWIALLTLWVISTKVWKILPALARNPSDCFLIPVQIIFAYLHSFYKLWALLTFWNCDWSGRRLDDINEAEQGQSGAVLDDLADVEILI